VRPLLQWQSSITYSQCVFVALGIQHAIRMRHTVICGLSGCTIFFHIISYTARLKKNLLNFFLFSVQGLSEMFPILRRTEQDSIKNVNWSSCKLSVVRF